MNLTKPQLIIIGAVAFVVVVLVLIFTCTIPGLQSCNGPTPGAVTATLTFWGIGNSSEDYTNVFAHFKALYPKVEVNYREFQNPNDYKSALLNALAAGTGPDVFMIENNALPENIRRIAPAPTTAISLPQVESLFPQVVKQDFVSQGVVYALPVSIDTLALFYNRDIFGGKAVPLPPATWEDFKTAVTKIAEVDKTRHINLAAAAIGGSAKTVDHASDLLGLLMLQTGTQMTSSDFTQATFASDSGLNALNFYTQFANARNDTYTWNDQMPYSLDAFGQERVAMVFEYAAQIPDIKARNSFLNFAIAPMPQPSNFASKDYVYYPHYWGYTVSKQSRNAGLAWNFILSFVTDEKTARDFILKTGKPPALNSLVNSFLTNPDLSVFAKQALAARSWPQIDAVQISQIFSQMIESVITNQADPGTTLKNAENQVTQLMQKGF